jgi:hypothetical protein
MSSALSRAVLNGYLGQPLSEVLWKQFEQDWAFLASIPLNDPICRRGEDVAWKYHLRGYGAVHLATALFWQEAVGELVTLATFDRQLWKAGREAGLSILPGNLDVVLHA